MSRDDYFVLVYKILSYLYKCLKQAKKPNIDYLQPCTKDLPIEESYFNYIIEHMVKSNLIENVIIVPVDNAEPIIKIDESIRITPIGIEYLQENKMMKKASKYGCFYYTQK